MEPTLAVCGHIADTIEDAASLAISASLAGGIDYSFVPTDLTRAYDDIDRLRSSCLARVPEVRFHLPLGYHELSCEDERAGEEAVAWAGEAVRIAASRGGSTLTVHLGLPSDASPERLERSIARLRRLVEQGRERGVEVCLENLRWGLTSEPETFIAIVDGSGARVTFDVGHAVSSEAGRTHTPGWRFAAMLGDRIRNAHIYEREESCHIAPKTLDGIAPVLDALLRTSCDWWVIELPDEREAIRTRELVEAFVREWHAVRSPGGSDASCLPVA